MGGSQVVGFEVAAAGATFCFGRAFSVLDVQERLALAAALLQVDCWAGVA